MPLTQVDQGLLNQFAQYTGFKNRIINGAMMIAQRATSASVTGGGYFVLDRFRWSQDGSYGSTITPTISQDSSTPSSFIGNSMKFTVGTGAAPTTGQTALLEQYIEGFNTADLAFGTASAATVTLSFWVRASITGTYCVAFRNSAANRSLVREYTISAANTWEQKSITITGDTSGTWIGATNGTGLVVSFALGSGATYETTAGTWVGGGYYVATSNQTDLTATTGATWFVTGVQLEKGSTATSFDYRPYGTELALCQRYFWAGRAAMYGYYGFGGNVPEGTWIAFPNTMRASPTITFGAATAAQSTNSESANYTSVDGFFYTANVTATAVAGRVNPTFAAAEL
jgi:hypothetical protein